MGTTHSTVVSAGSEAASSNDPRSPTKSVKRTPVRKFDREARFDPRSPSQEIARTPLQVPQPQRKGGTPSRAENEESTSKNLFPLDSDRAPLVERI